MTAIKLVVTIPSVVLFACVCSVMEEERSSTARRPCGTTTMFPDGRGSPKASKGTLWRILAGARSKESPINPETGRFLEATLKMKMPWAAPVRAKNRDA